MTSAVPLLKSVRGSRWNFLAMCSRTRDMPGGIFTPPPVAGKRRKKTVAGTRVNSGTGTVTHQQWRRQTMKSGSTFRSQLYFQVGQTEGPKVPSYSQETRSARGGGVWGVPIRGSVAYTPENFFQKSTFKSRVFCIFAN